MRASIWLDVGAVFALKLGVSALILAGGFRAISDDDYARLVIAQRFAESPALDPSGTSWLPLPFWVYGSGFAAFGNSLGVARGLAVLLGAASAVAVLIAARWLRLGRTASLAAAALAAIFPYSAYLGAATVPEAPASALVVLGAASLACAGPVRLAGAFALAAACASRYEPWPAALVFGAVTAFEAWKSRNRWLGVSACLAFSFPLAWLLHGVVRHDQALFFVSRVAKYRAALGPDNPFLARLLRTPAALFGYEPELVLGALGLGLLAALRSAKDPRAGAVARGSLCIGALIGTLILGDALGGAPTHHGERALLAAWLWCALLVAWYGERLRSQRGYAAPALAAGTLVLAVTLVRPLVPRAAFADRSAELDIGERARRHGGVDRLLLDADDYGYLATQASFGKPNQTLVLDDHDPRKPRARPLLADAPEVVHRRLVALGAHWLVVPNTRSAQAQHFAAKRAQNAGFALFELTANAPTAQTLPGVTP